ncbi:MAG: hypothetical protein UY91_C0028G0009 [Parcubacteria group bacterium GW2011_GWB1_55_9]|nr:MAG: hypothetical protein UY91_C0028G0009 [Parcubacteria group bacterium GW2011_GWB1_55_9]
MTGKTRNNYPPKISRLKGIPVVINDLDHKRLFVEMKSVMFSAFNPNAANLRKTIQII